MLWPCKGDPSPFHHMKTQQEASNYKPSPDTKSVNTLFWASLPPDLKNTFLLFTNMPGYAVLPWKLTRANAMSQVPNPPETDLETRVWMEGIYFMVDPRDTEKGPQKPDKGQSHHGKVLPPSTCCGGQWELHLTRDSKEYAPGLTRLRQLSSAIRWYCPWVLTSNRQTAGVYFYNRSLNVTQNRLKARYWQHWVQTEWGVILNKWKCQTLSMSFGFKVSLGYIMTSKPSWVIVGKKQSTQKHKTYSHLNHGNIPSKLFKALLLCLEM